MSIQGVHFQQCLKVQSQSQKCNTSYSIYGLQITVLLLKHAGGYEKNYKSGNLAVSVFLSFSF